MHTMTTMPAMLVSPCSCHALTLLHTAPYSTITSSPFTKVLEGLKLSGVEYTVDHKMVRGELTTLSRRSTHLTMFERTLACEGAVIPPPSHLHGDVDMGSQYCMHGGYA